MTQVVTVTVSPTAAEGVSVSVDQAGPPGPAGSSSTIGDFTALQTVAAVATASGVLLPNQHNPVDATTGNWTMTLPTGQPGGTRLSVERVDGVPANSLSVTGSIRGVPATTITLLAPSATPAHESVEFLADSSGSWWPIAGHKTKTWLDATYDATGAATSAVAGEVTARNSAIATQHAADTAAFASLDGNSRLAINGAETTAQQAGAVPFVGANTGIYYASFYAGASLDAKVAAAIAAAASAGGGTVVLPAGKYGTSDWLRPPLIPSGLPRELHIRGANRGATQITLSAACPRAFDFNRTANDQVFQLVRISDLVVDANHVDGPATGPATSVAAGITLAPGRTTLALASVAGWTVRNDSSSGVIYFASGAAAGRAMYYDTINTPANTISVRNDGASVTVATGDQVTGACVDHVLVGTLVASGTVPQNRMNFSNITVQRVVTLNVPTSLVTVQTSRGNIHFAPPNLTTDPYTYMTDFLIEDVDLGGGSSGICIAFPGQTGVLNAYVDRIKIRRSHHDTGLTPTMFHVSQNILLVGNANGGNEISVANFHGERSGDVGIEIDSTVRADVTDCLVEDAWTVNYYGINFNVPNVGVGQQTAISNGGAGVTAAASTIPVLSTAGFKTVGWLWIDNELVRYSGVTSTSFTGCIRGCYGTGSYVAATHSDGALVYEYEPEKQLYIYTRCRSRRTRTVVGDGVAAGYGWASFKASALTAPNMRFDGCTYARTTGDFNTAGEVIHSEGAPRTLEITGMKAFIRTSHTTADSLIGCAIYLTQNGGGATTFDNVPVPRMSIRGLRFDISCPLVSGTGHPNYNTFSFDRGAWSLDWSDLDFDTTFPNANPGATAAINMNVNSSSRMSGVIRTLRYANGTGQGDAAPRVITIPSSASLIVRGLHLTDWDLRPLMFASPGSLANYLPISIAADPANQAVIRIDGVIPSGILTVNPTPPTAVAGTSPYVYQNLDGYRERLIVQGGTVTKIEYSQDGVTFFDTGQTQGVISVDPGEYVRTTYTSGPTITKTYSR
jgi:hypothetical protein